MSEQRLTVTQWLKELPIAERQKRIRQSFEAIALEDQEWCEKWSRDPDLLQMVREEPDESTLLALLKAMQSVVCARMATLMNEKFCEEKKGGAECGE